MPLATKLIREERGLRINAHGVITGEDFLTLSLSLEAAPEAFRRFRCMMVDVSDITEMRVNSDHVRRIAEIDRRLATLSPSLCVAVVATRDDTFGLARMWEVMVEPTGWTTRVFRDGDEAERWVDEQLASR